MSVITENIDSRPYTGIRTVKGRVKVKTSEEAPHLDNFFNGTPNWDLVTGVTRGNVYEVVKVEGFGDCEDITFINDNGEEQTLADYFFTEVK